MVRFSADRMMRFADGFVRRLHQDIMALSPNAAGSLAGDGWLFCERMAQAVLWVALTDQPAGLVAGVLRQVGADNWREGFPDAEYVSVAHALVRTIRGLSDSDWFTSMGSAWISCFLWMQPHLLAGARQAAAEAEAMAGLDRAPGGPRPGERQAGDGRPHPAPVPGEPADVDLESVAGLLDDEDDQVGYGQIMLSMTLRSRKDKPHPEP